MGAGTQTITGRVLRSEVAWVSAHGGAGTTTLAHALGGADLGCRWPVVSQGEPAQVMLVARTHAQGLQAASKALNAMREGRHPQGMELVAVVLVADAPGNLPRPLANRVRVIRSVAPVYRIPWIAAWRIGQDIDRFPRQIARLDQRVRALPSSDQHPVLGPGRRKPDTGRPGPSAMTLLPAPPGRRLDLS